jgi:hypothetical protein
MVMTLGTMMAAIASHRLTVQQACVAIGLEEKLPVGWLRCTQQAQLAG